MIKVSVVVPIYNVEKYLRECVDSILGQTLKDLEIILVDDGSPDGCPEIVDEYARRDKRVVAIHQENAGYSTAVNYGIKIAKGEYIGIIESDDWIEPDMYEKLYADAKQNKTDVTKGMFTEYHSNAPVGARDEVYRSPLGIDLSLAPDGAFEITEWPKLMGFHASIWSAIYRADFIKKILIPETAGASYQDFPFMAEFLTKAERISVVRKPFVHWRRDPDQQSSTNANGKKLLLMAKNTKTGLDIIEKSGKMPKLKETIYIHALWTNMGFFMRIDSKYRKEYYEKLKAILLPIAKDKDFEYRFFRPQDKWFFNLVVNHNYPTVVAALDAMNAKAKIMGGVKRILGLRGAK